MVSHTKQNAPHRVTNDMMVFALVAEQQSFTRAAERLGLGRARVSQIITELELRLGATLLNRTTRSLSLTEVGAQYFETCQKIQSLSEQANTVAAQSNETVSGVLRIKTPVAGVLIFPFVSGFIRENPEIRVELIESDTPVDLVENRVDVAFASGPMGESSLPVMHVGSITEILVASSAYVENHNLPKTPEDLLKLDWISHHQEAKSGKLVLRRTGQPVLKYSKVPKVVAGSVASLKEFVLGDIGFSILPAVFFSKELASGKLVRLLPEYHSYEIPISIVYGYRNIVPAKVRAFLDFVQANSGKFIA